MLPFDGAIGQKQAIDDIRFKRFWISACHGGIHAANCLAVRKFFDWDRIRVGDEVPERQGGFIGLPVGQKDDFHFGQPILMIQTEGDNGCVDAASLHARPDSFRV